MSVFVKLPDRIERADIAVMQHTTSDELSAIQQLWPWFERRVGLQKRKMYAMVRAAEDRYTTCTPIGEDDDPEALGLDRGVLPGGSYLRGRLWGEPPDLYTRIGPGVDELINSVASADSARPVIEFYRRHDQVEVWVPIHT